MLHVLLTLAGLHVVFAAELVPVTLKGSVFLPTETAQRIVQKLFRLIAGRGGSALCSGHDGRMPRSEAEL